MPRIAILFEFGTLNGGEHSMLAALDELAASDRDIVALAPPQGRLADALRARGIRQLPIRLRDDQGTRLPLDQLRRQLADVIRGCNPAVVHANSLSMGRLAGPVAAELGIASCAHLRDILKLSGAAVDDLNRNRLLLAVSAATRSFHIAQGIATDRTRVLYNGVDLRRFQPRRPTEFLRRELGIPADRFLTLTVGQIALRKGQDVLAEAAGLIAQQTDAVDFVIVGERHSAKAESVAFEHGIFESFRAQGLETRVHRLGNRDDIPTLMNECNLLVHAAHQEPLGRVLLEAAASGLPIVATSVGGTAEILEDGRSARLVLPGEPRAIADAVLELVDNAERRERFARTARQVAEARFDVRQSAAALAAVWHALGERPKETV